MPIFFEGLKLELDNIIINQKETINNNEFQYFKNTMFFVKGKLTAVHVFPLPCRLAG